LPQLADESVALCADARLQHWPRATHWIIHDEPKAVQEALLDFMQTQPSRDVP
jgi:pimeloyl-ACP methyl ester carboxylesterase